VGGDLVQQAVDICIGAFPTGSPFKAGQAPDKIIPASVTVFGKGVAVTDSLNTPKPSLVYIASTTNVLGNATYTLTNPNGWYCVTASTNVMGNVTIRVRDRARLAVVNQDTGGIVATNVSGNVKVEVAP
jgi:hypothetical protein